jgi:hypothetical protein
VEYFLKGCVLVFSENINGPIYAEILTTIEKKLSTTSLLPGRCNFIKKISEIKAVKYSN